MACDARAGILLEGSGSSLMFYRLSEFTFMFYIALNTQYECNYTPPLGIYSKGFHYVVLRYFSDLSFVNEDMTLVEDVKYASGGGSR